MSEAPKTETPALDPFVEKIVKSIDNVIDPTATITEPEPMSAPPSLRDIVEQRAAGKPPIQPDANPEEKPKEPDGQKPDEHGKKPDEPQDKPADTKPADNPAPPDTEPRAKVVRKKITSPAEPAPAPQPQPSEEPKTGQLSAEDQEYIKSLTPEQQEEIEIAQFAEAKGKAGVVAKTLEFYRRVDKFIADNPDTKPEDSAYAEFINANRKQVLSPSERRKFERDLITEQAVERAKKALEPAVDAQKQKLREIETKPAIDEAISLAEATMTAPPDKGLAPIPADVAKVIREQGYSAAADQFPIEAPLVSGAINATEAFIKIARGVTRFDELNPTHAWLAQFIAQEGARFKRQPQSVTVVDGKTFLPIHEYAEAVKKDPAAESKHYTFSEEMVVDLIASNAVLGVNARHRELEKAGYVRKNSGAAGKQPDPVPQNTDTQGGSPKAGSTALPGAANNDSGKSESAEFIDGLVPGASKRLGLK